jgi:hypothetical protein
MKLRNVLNDVRKEEVCLDDVVMAFASSSEKFRMLEYKNSIHSFREASKALNRAKKTLKDFEERFRGEIKESIVKELSRTEKRLDSKNIENNDKFFLED